jgi:hypothetical protein
VTAGTGRRGERINQASNMGGIRKQENQSMRTRNLSRAIICFALLVAAAPAHALTQQELVAKLEAAGYTMVSDVKSTAEGIVAKAIKNGKEVRVVVDSNGQIKEQN